MPIVAAIQMCSVPEVAANCAAAERLIAAAAAAGAELVALPENWFQMGHADTDKLALAEAEGHGPLQDFLAAQARRHGVWLLGGTLPLHGEEPGRVCAASLLFDARGHIGARYDKVHLFDVDVDDATGAYRESATVEPGERIVVADTPCGRLGFSVCYDLRFPELFRAMSAAGAELFVVPAAFTAVTGRAHWEVLLRARAIENQACVIGVNRVGADGHGVAHAGGSAALDALGRPLVELGNAPALETVMLDLGALRELRQRFPAALDADAFTLAPTGGPVAWSQP